MELLNRMQHKVEKTRVSESSSKPKPFAAILIVCVFVFLVVTASVSVVTMFLLSNSESEPDPNLSKLSNRSTESFSETDARVTTGEKAIRYSVVKMDRQIGDKEDQISVDLFATDVGKKPTREELTSIWESDLQIRVSKKFPFEKPTVVQIRMAYSIQEQPGFSCFEMKWKDGQWEELKIRDFN